MTYSVLTGTLNPTHSLQTGISSWTVVSVAARRFRRLFGAGPPAVGGHPQATAAVRRGRPRGGRGTMAVGQRAHLPQRRLLRPDHVDRVRLRHRPVHLPRLHPRLRPGDRRGASAEDERVRQQRGAVRDQHRRKDVPGTSVYVPGAAAFRRRRQLVILCVYVRACVRRLFNASRSFQLPRCNVDRLTFAYNAYRVRYCLVVTYHSSSQSHGIAPVLVVFFLLTPVSCVLFKTVL